MTLTPSVLQASVEIQGPGCTPFDMNNQNLLINAFAAVMPSVTRADFLIRYFTSDDSKVPTFGSGSSGRRLLQAQVSFKGQPEGFSTICLECFAALK